jgi:plasmid stabilization system protein ParE
MGIRNKPFIRWNKKAVTDFEKNYRHIRKDSFDSAEKVKFGIVEIIDSLIDHPEKYPLDKFKKDNPGNYRAFEKFSIRIAYRHLEHEIRILRFRHIKREPKEY